MPSFAWLIDLENGVERQLTHLPADFDLRDFDLSPDDRALVLERVEERSGIVLISGIRRHAISLARRVAE